MNADEPLSIQSEIRRWHESVFGNENSPGRITRTAKKTLEEAAELYVAARFVKSVEETLLVMTEVADVAITCYAIAIINGLDLERFIRERLEVLKQRPDQKQRDRDRGIS